MVSPRPLEDEDVADPALNVDRDNIVRFLNLFELRMDEGFVQVEDQGLFAFAMVRLWSQEPLVPPKSRLGTNFI